MIKDTDRRNNSYHVVEAQRSKKLFYLLSWTTQLNASFQFSSIFVKVILFLTFNKAKIISRIQQACIVDLQQVRSTY